MKFRIFRTRFYCYFVMTDGLKCFSCSVVKVSQLRQSGQPTLVIKGSPLKAHKKINLRPSFENTGAEARLPRRSAKILSGVAFRSALEGRCLYNNSTEYSVQSVWNTAER
ncbi:uncharacterized protein TrAFT101_004294 [Trichoderma asperellum]|uniref:uncharacterized protein n=1 Tax=Trichoderma asperellum TaxID=101201 RepID=UPI003319EEA1|nr:hypothetical protein TrAFT101_004294 [Trichoderma asperellum]